jgi:hypothetical protein
MVLFPHAALPLVAFFLAPTHTPTATCLAAVMVVDAAAAVMQNRPATYACIVRLNRRWTTAVHHAQIRPLPTKRLQGLRCKTQGRLPSSQACLRET